MQQPADILEENEQLRVRLQELEDVVRALRNGLVGASVHRPAAAEAYPFRTEMLVQLADAVISVDESDRITFLNAAAEHRWRQTEHSPLETRRRWHHRRARAWT